LNEQRFESLLQQFVSLDFDAIVLDAADTESVGRAFERWSEERRQWRRAG
jgi:hypothetical protein